MLSLEYDVIAGPINNQKLKKKTVQVHVVNQSPPSYQIILSSDHSFYRLVE